MNRSIRHDKREVINVYRKRAKRYDFTVNLYYLIGWRWRAYQKKAVQALNLQSGDTVVEVGCGTGLNFPLLRQAVGPEGKIVGVDVTDAMLVQARKRVEENSWSNVELVQADAASFHFPTGVGGIISTFAISLIPEFDQVIQNGSEALVTGGRWVILDFKLPSSWLARLAPWLVFLGKPFGLSLELAERHTWESIDKYLKNTSLTELYGGFVYIAIGEPI